MKTGICAGTIYRTMDVEILVAYGGMDTQLVNFIKMMNERIVILDVLVV